MDNVNEFDEEAPTMVVEDNTDTLDEYIEKMSDAERRLHLSVYFTLQSSEKFNDFVMKNFEVQQHVDHEKRIVSLQVVDLNPPEEKKPFLVSDEMAADCGEMLQKEFECKSPGKAMLKILEILNGRNYKEPSVLIASEADLNKELQAKRVADKLIK